MKPIEFNAIAHHLYSEMFYTSKSKQDHIDWLADKLKTIHDHTYKTAWKECCDKKEKPDA